MKLKFITMGAFIALATTSISAQGFKVGVEAGYDNVKFTSKEEYTEVDFYYDERESDVDEYENSLNGFHIGPTFNFDFGKDASGLGLKVGLFWQHASGKDFIYEGCENKSEYDEIQEDEEEWCGKWKSVMKHDAILLPIRLSYTYMLNDNFGVYAFAGPKLEIGVNLKNKNVWKDCEDDDVDKYVDIYNYFNGKYKYKEDGKDVTESEDNEDAEADLNRFNIDLGLGFGVTYKNMYVQFSYDWGLLNRCKEKSGGESNGYYKYSWEEKMHNKNMAVSVGVTF